MYDMLRQHIQQCSTMYDKNDFPTTELLSHPKVLHVKHFFKICSIANENLRLTANNHDKWRQFTKNYDFLICTLSHLKIRMWETSITVRWPPSWAMRVRLNRALSKEPIQFVNQHLRQVPKLFSYTTFLKPITTNYCCPCQKYPFGIWWVSNINGDLSNPPDTGIAKT